MNPAGLRTYDGDRARPGPLPFGVESLLEAERWPGSEPVQPLERLRGTAEPRTWFPPAAPSSAPTSTLRPPETKEQPQEADAFHHRAAAGAGAQVRSAAVPVHRGAHRVLHQPQSLRDAGQDLVSEPAGQGQATAGG
ncbi:unnamed protein product [Rangifer tarandus platyrhynchus]|uniref:Uncharacterized protein n=2 Tax=Rangifer tarandus platyrhynchus TaxID=3082113 RepID=A0AC60A4T0_RANTA|nr:unnamed protein product [Rangifer tarandus platyrhynchus]